MRNDGPFSVCRKKHAVRRGSSRLKQWNKAPFFLLKSTDLAKGWPREKRGLPKASLGRPGLNLGDERDVTSAQVYAEKQPLLQKCKEGVTPKTQDGGAKNETGKTAAAKNSDFFGHSKRRCGKAQN